ncbi:MAG: type I restriction endonuclease subunit R [Paludibacteraceae bacterium]|nr:type I restriction endonuclease subunit R [Paludibacteraceae bacterium]
MAKDYSEDQLIQKSTAELLEKELGWKSVYAFDNEVLGEQGTLGRKTQSEVVLTRHLRLALKRLNPWMTDKQLAEAIERMTSYMSSQTLMQINEEKYGYLRDGVPVTRLKPNGETELVRAKVMDFANVDNNEFIAVRELWIKGPIHKRRADVVCFVNGLPLIFIELKNHDQDIQNAYTDNYRDYLDTIPHLFHHNAMIMLSNGLESRVGTVGAKWEFFHEWKRLTELEHGNIELPTMLRGICKKENLLDLLENFILFDHSGGSTVKILARNHQYLGVNQAVEMYRHRKAMKGKLGVFWHTQGSGKSYSMVFLAQKIRRKFEGSPTIVVLTDREELNKQISDTFENCGLLGGLKAKQFIAHSGDDLRQKLTGNPSFIFSLIQKFNKADAEPIYPVHDIIVMSDEAHRSQNGVFADNLMHMLPTANRIGFTGTPLLRDDNITARTFGQYVSIYDFKRAVEDKATVPLYYENRGEKLQDLKNPEINAEIAAALEQAGEMDASQLAKLEQEFAKEVHLLTAEKRLRFIATDFVHHYSYLWTSGKAMFVCYDKVTCVRMFNYVQEYWQQEIKSLEGSIDKCTSQQEVQEMQRKLLWMQETDMAVVVSQEQNEIQTFQKWGLDIKPHREKMEKRELDKEFKDADSKLRVVFVCAMWLTGFDVKTLSCLYIDKPMKAHTLMQTIARANRVAEGKANGLIIDYIGIVKALRQALADYTANPDGERGGNDPTIDKKDLVEHVMVTIAATTAFLKEHGFELGFLIKAKSFDKLSLLKKGANAMCETAEIRKSYCTFASTLLTLWKYLDREDITSEMKQRKDSIEAIYKELQKKRKHADITDLSVAISRIVNEHLEIEEEISMVAESKHFDISSIDFDLLRREFAKRKDKNLVMRDIQELLQERLEQMLAENPSRINFYEKYQEIIHDYNLEQNRASIERTFEELMHLSQSLTEEEKRYVREGFKSDEELSLYDLLLKENLSKTEIKKLKDIAIELLAKIKEQLSGMDHPFDKPTTRATLIITIRDVLWQELPESYSEESINYYRDTIYNYVSQRYGGVA